MPVAFLVSDVQEVGNLKVWISFLFVVTAVLALTVRQTDTAAFTTTFNVVRLTIRQHWGK